MAARIVAPVPTVFGPGARLRGPNALPRHATAPVGKPRSGPSAPIVGAQVVVSRPARLRLTERGLALLAIVLVVQFVVAACLIVTSFLAVSNDPIPASAAVVSQSIPAPANG